MAGEEWVPTGIDITVPSVARVYDFFLGGKDNFAVDRQVAEMMLTVAPDAPEAGKANREFLQRVVRYLAAEAGIRQFLDIGSGLPTVGNVHEIAHASASGVKVVYVDNDPIVLAHGRALLAEDNSTIVVQADLRDPEEILDHPAVREFIDSGQPVGLLLFAILHHLRDDEDPGGIMARLIRALPAGSHVAISHFHNPGAERPEVAAQATAVEKIFNETLGTGRWRSGAEILAFLGDLELVEPGLVPLPEWRPALNDHAEQSITYHTFVGVVGRKN